MTAVDAHPEPVRFPLMEVPAVGVLLATMAGLTNAWTLAHVGTFSTVQSGNIVQIGYRLAEGNWTAFWFAFWSVIAFGLGSAACGIVMTLRHRQQKTYSRMVLAFEFLALVLLGLAAQAGLVAAHFVAYGVSFVAGAQGNAFHKSRGMLYGNVAVTFVVQMAFNFLVQALFKRDGINGVPNLVWAGIFFAMLGGFAAGGLIGFLADLYILDQASLFLAALVALAIWARSLSVAEPDPTPGGMIG